MKPLTARQIISVLKKNGFVLSRQKGSHSIWKNVAKHLLWIQHRGSTHKDAPVLIARKSN